ncbi:MAG TPA: SemiSWEET transporter [Niastella sp.]|nr:SemiSWEET transporter [Niastella sp.]
MSNYTQIIGIASGVLTSASLLPQLIKIIREKKAESVSMGTYILLLVGVSGWILYGIEKNDIPIIATNCFSFVANIFILIFSVRYKRKEASK